jgi:hypothetical protein
MRAFADTISGNQILESLSLEFNDLTDDGKDKSAFRSFMESISGNKSLQYINLSHCGLDEVCGKYIEESMTCNKSVLDIDISGNPISMNKMANINRLCEVNRIRRSATIDRERQETIDLIREDHQCSALVEIIAIRVAHVERLEKAKRKAAFERIEHWGRILAEEQAKQKSMIHLFEAEASAPAGKDTSRKSKSKKSQVKK